jgi:Ca-activated chloride channel family protein
VEVSVHRRARACAFLSVLALPAVIAACDRPPPAPPPPPWLVEVASIDGSADAGLTRCSEGACARVAEHTILGAGAALRAERGSRAVLALDASTELSFAGGAEVELRGGAERTVVVKRGSAVVRRKEEASSSSPRVAVETAGRAIVVSGGPSAAIVRAPEADGRASAVVLRGRAALRDGASERALATGEGARWKAGEAPSAFARWAAGDEEQVDAAAEPSHATAVRGLGTMTARVPGTSEIVSGVRLAVHHVSAEVRDGFARTTVEEEFENETSRTLEGRFTFALPPDASISRLALYVGEELVEGEIVDKPLASRVFKAIVDDSVRPRDPALLEWTSGGAVSLKVFPIPAKGRRRVILAYDQALSERGERVRYVYPLSPGPDRATPIDDFAVSVAVKDSAAKLGSAEAAGYDASMSVDEQGITAAYSAKSFAPASDFVLRYSRGETTAASLSWSAGPKEVAARAAPGERPAGYFALRVRADAPEGFAQRRWAKAARAFVIDTSHSQGADTIDAAIRVVKASIAGLDPDDRFAILACDSACESYPEDGLAAAGDEAIDAASAWLSKRSAAGSSDVAGALLAAAARLSPEGGGQGVYCGDGVATSGELGAAAIAARVAPALAGLDSHFVGVGHLLDESAMSAIAGAANGTYERLATGDPIAQRAAEIARNLEAPVIRDARLVLPEGSFDVVPEKLPRLRLGQEVQVLGRFRLPDAKAEPENVHASIRTGDAEKPARGPLREVRLAGEVGGKPYEIVRSLDWGRAIAAASPAVHALWARAKIAALETAGDPSLDKEIVRLSTLHHVLSHKTALLVLENERMFVETGVRAAIERALAAEPASGAAPGGGATGRVATSRSSAADDAAAFGLIGVLSAPQAPAAPWARETVGDDPMSARGNMWGNDIGKSFGAGGLGLSGIGEGGGGQGTGSIGTIGHGAGTTPDDSSNKGSAAGTSQGFGSGHGLLGGSHSSSPPRVRMGATSVSGRLPPEVIQRIVRQTFGRFRLCYEDGLRSNPNLQGRVAVRFVIDREGSATSVSNGGSDLPDASVVSCVVRAFVGLRFPQPEDGIVTVVYPITFSPGDGSTASSSSSSSSPVAAPWSPLRPRLSNSWRAPVSTSWPRWAPNPLPDAPVVAHRSPDEAPAADDAAIAKLLAQAADPGAKRSAHQALVRKLLASGRFEDAFGAASRYLGLDPDHEVALELYAESAAATGRTRAAVMAIDAQVETDPTSAARHRRAAAAFEAAGDERRACAHFRSLASLPGAEESAQFHALRCRARLGERAEVLAEARALAKPSSAVAKLITALEAGSAPPYVPPPAAGSFEVRVACSGEVSQCPAPIVVGPTGTVISPWTPAAPCSRSALAFTNVAAGTYRTLLTGDVPATGAEVTVRVLGQSKSITIARPGTQVALATTVTLPEAPIARMDF